jgi:hypothetical protein
MPKKVSCIYGSWKKAYKGINHPKYVPEWCRCWNYEDKIEIFDNLGNLVADASVGSNLFYTNLGWVEKDPDKSDESISDIPHFRGDYH